MKAALVVNRAAGQSGGAALDVLARALTASGFDLAQGVDGPWFGLDALDVALAEAGEAVIALGGDGTMRAVAERLLGSPLALGVLPGGTMNLLARDLRMPLDPLAAAIALSDAEIRSMDVGKVADRVFLCASVIGSPARLARHRENQRGRWNLALMWHMARAGVASIQRYPRRRYVVEIDGRSVHVWTRAITIANNAFDLGFTESASRSRLDAGLFSVYVMRNVGLVRYARTFFAFYAGDLRRQPEFDHYEAVRLSVSGEQPRLRVMSDGEVELIQAPVTYELLPGALKVLVPRTAAVGPAAPIESPSTAP